MNNIAPQPINRILDSEQIEQVLQILLINKPVRLLKFFARTGRNESSVPWIYFENEITGDRIATFVSFNDVFSAFLIWLETAQVLLLAFWQRIAISKVIWQFVQVGDRVYSEGFGCVEVVEKDITEGQKIPRFWIAADDCLDSVMPCDIRPF